MPDLLRHGDRTRNYQKLFEMTTEGAILDLAAILNYFWSFFKLSPGLNQSGMQKTPYVQNFIKLAQKLQWVGLYQLFSIFILVYMY